MKNIILILAVLLTLSVNAQITRESKTNTKEVYRGAYSLTLTQFILNESDTSFALYFQNRKYSSITDLHYISFRNKKDLEEFLYIALETIGGESQNVRVGKQSLYLSKITGGVYISTDRAYLILSRKDIETMLNSLK